MSKLALAKSNTTLARSNSLSNLDGSKLTSPRRDPLIAEEDEIQRLHDENKRLKKAMKVSRQYGLAHDRERTHAHIDSEQLPAGWRHNAGLSNSFCNRRTNLSPGRVSRIVFVAPRDLTMISADAFRNI